MLTEQELKIKEKILNDYSIYSNALSKLSDNLKDDFDVGKIAVSSDPANLKYLSDRLKDNKDFMTFAVIRSKNAFVYASERLKEDEAFVLTALKSSLDSSILNQIGDNLKNNKRLFLYILEELSSTYFKDFPEKMKDDEDVVIKAITLRPKLIEYASKRLQRDSAFFEKIKNLGLIDLPKDLKTKLDTTIKLQDILLVFVRNVTKQDVLKLKQGLFQAIMKINNSKIHNFNKILNGTIAVLKKEDAPSENSVASYDYNNDYINYFLDISSKNPSIDIIHEFAHKFHHKHIHNGFKNPRLLNLFNKSNITEGCMLPQIGDSISDLNLDKDNKWWWAVEKRASKEYILTSITNSSYVYENDNGEHITFPKSDMLKMIRCPSQYGTKNVMEFFAEMCVLVTLDKIKPNQKALVKQFLEIVKDDYI